MRRELERIAGLVDRIDSGNLYQAIEDTKQALYALIRQIDKALPVDEEDN